MCRAYWKKRRDDNEGKSILKDTYRAGERNERERTGKLCDISLKSSVPLYKVIGYAEVKCSVLSLNKITPPISYLAAFTDACNPCLCISLSLRFLGKLLAT